LSLLFRFQRRTACDAQAIAAEFDRFSGQIGAESAVFAAAGEPAAAKMRPKLKKRC
jgi:hypothetical protein